MLTNRNNKHINIESLKSGMVGDKSKVYLQYQHDLGSEKGRNKNVQIKTFIISTFHVCSVNFSHAGPQCHFHTLGSSFRY